MLQTMPLLLLARFYTTALYTSKYIHFDAGAFEKFWLGSAIGMCGRKQLHAKIRIPKWNGFGGGSKNNSLMTNSRNKKLKQ